MANTSVGKWQTETTAGLQLCRPAFLHKNLGGFQMTMTQMQAARAGKITDEMKIVAQEENMDINVLKERVANGTIAICANINHKNLHPYGVGEGLCTKVNANIGTSSAFPDPEPEIEKLNIAIAAGAHSVMDLSTGNNIDASRLLPVFQWHGANLPLSFLQRHRAL